MSRSFGIISALDAHNAPDIAYYIAAGILLCVVVVV